MSHGVVITERIEACILLVPLAIILGFSVSGNTALDCFKCVSVGGDHPPCEDPFHNNFSADILEAPCWTGRKHRDGLFPATACVKLAGKFDDTGQEMVVRGCALDSGTLTVDTEIVRMSHCGGFYFEDRYVRGCIQSCFDDGCNGALFSVVPSDNNMILFVMCALLTQIIESSRLMDL